MLKIIFFTFLFTLGSEEERSRFSADTYTRVSKDGKDKIILEGNVVVTKGATTIKADKLELDSKTNKYKAEGNVLFRDKDSEIIGRKIEGELDSARSTIIDGRIVSDNDIFEGTKIERMTRQHFIIDEGSYTSCKNDPADWRIYSNSIDMTTGDYAYLNDVVIETFGLPMVYLPYLILPIKNERQSGFLPPDFGFGTDGFNINLPYFWAISRSQDATFTLGHYGNRGRKEALEFRSVYNSLESFTQMYYFHISDKKFASIIYNEKPLAEKHRHGFKMNQDIKMTDVSYLKARLRYVSDDNIPRDFPEEMEGRADPALESKLMLTTRTENISYTASASYYEDLLSKNPLDSNEMQLQRLPELSVNFAKTKYSIFMLEADASYLNIYRPGPYFDDTSGNLVLPNQVPSNNDFIRTGQRFDLFPRVSAPLNTGFLELTPYMGFRYNYYMLPTDENANRNYMEIGTKITSEISKVYQRGEDKQYRAVKHSVEPFIEYQVIPNVNQSAHPFFDNSSSTHGRTPMFDSIDNINRTNTITYGINNRLITKYIRNFIKPEPEADTKCSNCELSENDNDQNTDDFLGLRHSYRTTNDKKDDEEEKRLEHIEDFSVLQPLQWRIRQSYDFFDETDQPFSYIYSDIIGSYEWISVFISNFYNVYTKRMGTSSSIRLSGRQKYIQIGYYNDKTTERSNTDQIHLRFGFGIWRFFTNVRFIFNNALPGNFNSKIQDKYLDVTYAPPSGCWLLNFGVNAPYDRPGVNIMITFNLLISGQSIGFGSEGSFMETASSGSAF